MGFRNCALGIAMVGSMLTLRLLRKCIGDFDFNEDDYAKKFTEMIFLRTGSGPDLPVIPPFQGGKEDLLNDSNIIISRLQPAQTRYQVLVMEQC